MIAVELVVALIYVSVLAAGGIWLIRRPGRVGPRRRRRSCGEPRLVILADRHGRLILRSPGCTTRMLARVLAGRLDRHLANGRPPESHLLLAARARQLTTPAGCRRLADRWQQVATVRPPPDHWQVSPTIAYKQRVDCARGEIDQLLAALQTPGVKAVRGLAIAHVMLADCRGPLHDPQCPTDLSAAVRDAIGHLDPLDALAGWTGHRTGPT